MLLHLALVILFIVFILVVSKNSCVIDIKLNEGDVCLVDCVAAHTILRDKRYFLDLTLTNANVSTISGTANLVESS